MVACAIAKATEHGQEKLMKTKKLAYWASVTTLGIVLGVSLQFVKAWTEPTAPAPAGNVGAPINTSAVPQTKNGVLNINSTLGVTGIITTDSRIGIGTLAPTAKLEVAGTPGVDGIKFPDGTLQKTAAGGPGAQVSGGMYGYCAEVCGGSFSSNCNPSSAPTAVHAPSIASGVNCSCQPGYEVVKTGGGDGLAGAVKGYNFYSCYKN